MTLGWQLGHKGQHVKLFMVDFSFNTYNLSHLIRQETGTLLAVYTEKIYYKRAEIFYL